jgi:hypothetical protein
VKKDNEKITVEKDLDISRRNFLLGGAAAIVGGVLAGSIGGSLIKPGTAHAALPGWLPPPPVTTNPLNLHLVRKFAYNHYFDAGG